MGRWSTRVFLVEALINPLPVTGVAMEIRSALLTVGTRKERVEMALDRFFQFVTYMDGSAPT